MPRSATPSKEKTATPTAVAESGLNPTAEKIRVALQQAEHDRAHAIAPFTDEAKADFLNLLRAGMAVFDIAVLLGVSRTTIYRVRRADPDFESEWADAIEARYIHIEERLADIAHTGDPSSMATVRAGEVIMKGTNRRYSQGPRMPAMSASIQQGGADGPRFTMTLGQPGPE